MNEMNSQNRRAIDAHRQRRHRSGADDYAFTRTLLLPSLLLAASAVGCSAMEEVSESEGGLSESEAQFGSTSEELAVYTPGWVPWGSTIRVCFRGVPVAAPPSAPAENTARPIIMDVLKTGWQASAAITFQDEGTCRGTTNAAGEFVFNAESEQWLKILLTDGGAGACPPPFGPGATCSLNITGGENGIRFFATHEVGHALGMGHEHQRDDQPPCPDQQVQLDYWHTVSQGTPAPPSCKTCMNACCPNNVNAVWPYDAACGGCFGPGVTQPDRAARAEYELLSIIADPDLVKMTIPQPWTSVMDYCTVSPYPAPFGPRPAMLSPMDRLGIEMTYPFSFSRRPAAMGTGISNFDGSSVIVRSSAPTTLTLDWITRGAHLSFFTSVRWRSLPSGTIVSTSKSWSPTLSNAVTYEVEANDAFGRHHSWTGATFTPSDAKYHAIVSTPVNYLLL
jgi:hypothetical protein